MVSLGVDVGGTGCKCAAFSEEGLLLAQCYEEYPLPPGTVDLPPKLLKEAVFRVIVGCVRQLPDAGEAAAITVSSFGESFVPVDRQGEPLTDILLYFANAESEHFSNLVRQVGEERFKRIAMILPDASYSLSKMLYTQKVAQRPVWKYLFVAGYLTFCLSGQPVSDESLACRSLLYDVRSRCWSRELTDACGIDPDTLPDVLPTGTAVGNLLPQVAQQLGLPQSVQVVLGSHDQIVCALGAGVRVPGDCVDAAGTCECMTPLFSDIPSASSFVEHNFACVPYLQTGNYVTYAYNISAGSVVRWCRDLFSLNYGQLNSICPETPTDLMILPFLQGMGGTPHTDAGATGCILGLTTATTKAQIYRGLLEGITYELRYNRQCLAEDGVAISRLLACGGGAASKPWMQLKADILGCEILPTEAAETGALGSAILGFSAILKEDPLAIAARLVRYGQAVRPIAEHSAIYEDKYALYKQMRKLYTESRK